MVSGSRRVVGRLVWRLEVDERCGHPELTACVFVAVAYVQRHVDADADAGSHRHCSRGIQWYTEVVLVGTIEVVELIQ